MNQLVSRLNVVRAATASAILVPSLAFAQTTPVDVSQVTAAINGAAVPIAAIGASVLLVLVGIKVFKWVRRAM